MRYRPSRLPFISALVLSSFVLGSCAAQRAAERERAAREAIAGCNATFPTSVPRQNALRVQCLADAENRIYGPIYPYPDLLNLKHEYRLALAKKVDRDEMTAEDARLRFAEITTRIQNIYEQRRNARARADAETAQALYSGLALLQSSRPITTSCNRFGTTTNCSTY